MVPARVNISTVFKTVIEINEQDHTIELKFAISLKWYESRASYYNLKPNPALNVLNGDEIRKIWIPYVVFDNTDSNEAITLDDVKSTVFVTREGDFTRTGLESVDEAEVFKGADNMITMFQTHSKKFHCTYLLHNFPFDTQVPRGSKSRLYRTKLHYSGLLCSYGSGRF